MKDLKFIKWVSDGQVMDDLKFSFSVSFYDWLKLKPQARSVLEIFLSTSAFIESFHGANYQTIDPFQAHQSPSTPNSMTTSSLATPNHSDQIAQSGLCSFKFKYNLKGYMWHRQTETAFIYHTGHTLNFYDSNDGSYIT